ncbi:MAG: hypothetical protein ACREJM_02935 [Candidatus Saccharimonadales bacterium]
MEKALDDTSSSDFATKVPDIKTFGNPDGWRLLSKASSVAQGWMKSTKVMLVPGAGLLVQVSTCQDSHVAEALQLVPGAFLLENADGTLRITSFLQGIAGRPGYFLDKEGKWSHE